MSQNITKYDKFIGYTAIFYKCVPVVRIPYTPFFYPQSPIPIFIYFF